ncbi:glucitol operon activator protein [Lentibacillus halodurans]|uniref:Glucitol operon activator protein n=1 Tax=Lentibacillus halodurans TaxID=237679 RepID=A0A1I0XJ73_9BACI|nr:transcriptional regulator GutM [Lentibacillus halodurans]SFB00278.1 glucitol operon activator protein [Lentibacillus halodurans]
MWGTFIFIFTSIWALQFLLTHFQVKHYQSEIKKLSNRDNGFLGTGYYKKRFGTGAIIVLVCDEHSRITDAKIMKGITVFARFRNMKQLVGMKLEESKFVDFLPKKEHLALTGAIDMIKKEMNKRKGNEAWIS